MSSAITDYVLVYRGSSLNEEQQLKMLLYERSLLQTGLILRIEQYRDLTFVKVNVPDPILYRYAELLRLRMPIKIDDEMLERSTTSDDLLRRFLSFLSITTDQKTYKLTAEFSRDKTYLFDEADPDFFNTASRVIVAAYIIERASYGDIESSGIEPLILDKVFLHAYPLHDGSMTDKASQRYKLYKNWASFRNWGRRQPLDDIRDYFGTKVALYFTWLGFYNRMLIPATMGGLVTIFMGLLVLRDDGFAKDVCTLNVTMCPLCDKYCPYWDLRSSCNLVKWSHFSDNVFTIAYSVIMCIWNTIYLVMWKRHKSTVTYNWGLANHHITAEPTRPEYLFRLRNVKRRRLNVLTLTPEPYVPFWRRQFPIYLFTGMIVLSWITLAVFLYLSLIFYQMTLLQLKEVQIRAWGQHYVTGLNSVINLLLIVCLYYLYKRCANWLTEIELHRTQHEHEDSLSMKLYAYQFVSHYTPVFYLAFLKGNFVGIPGQYIRILGVRGKECIAGGCLWEVMEYIMITMTVKQAGYLLLSRFFPVWNMYKWKFGAIVRHFFKDAESHPNQIIDDYKLLDSKTSVQHLAYLDMVIQFGFVSMFVNAFPLAHAFALVHNILRIRFDALRILKYHRRPVPKLVKDVGIWVQVIYFICRISVFTNAFMIAMSPRFIPRILFYYEGLTKSDGRGFLKRSLSKFDTRDFEKGTEPVLIGKNMTSNYCYFFGLREPPEEEGKYNTTFLYWKVAAVKFGFIIVYYVLANLLINLVQLVIPSVPSKVAAKIQMENFHVNRAIMRREKRKML